MSRVARVTKADVARVCAGLKAVGETIGRVEMRPNGEVIILTGKPEATLSPLERARAERDRRAP